jgi:predicted transcriptional regulator
MARKPTLMLGDSEMEALTHVWELKEATVAQVHERILSERKVAYTTVMTVMQNLTKKGYLNFRKDGATYIYTAAKDPSKVRMDFLGHLINKVFKGSPAAMMQTLVQSEDISETEKDEIRSMIDSMD